MGPTCEVLLPADDDTTLDAIDALLVATAEQINRTRKGRVWDVWIGGRPIHVHVTGSPPTAELSAGCNAPEDYTVLRQLSMSIAHSVGGLASEPEK